MCLQASDDEDVPESTILGSKCSKLFWLHANTPLKAVLRRPCLLCTDKMVLHVSTMHPLKLRDLDIVAGTIIVKITGSNAL